MTISKIILNISALVLIVWSLMMPPGISSADPERDPDIDIRLRYAIVQGDAESVKNVLDQGANANAVYLDGGTPLAEGVARYGGSTDILRLLIHAGADPKVKSNGSSLLSLALKMNNDELMRFLREYSDSDAELYEVAVYYWNRAQERLALEYAEKALKLNQLNAEAWALEGTIFLSEYMIKDAEMAYRNAFKASLTHLKAAQSETRYTMAVRYALMSSDFSEALRLANEGLSRYPQNGDLELNSAHAQLLLGRNKESLGLYRKARADLKRSEQNADRAGQVCTEDFIHLTRRFPDKAQELKWAEERILKPFDFKLDEMPFGEETDAVLSMVQGAVIEEKEKPVLGSLDPLLVKRFRNGFYPGDGTAQLHPASVKKITVAYDKWDDLQIVDLYFAGPERQRKLFWVSKFYKESGESNAVFSRYLQALSGETGMYPAYHSAETAPSGQIPLRTATWESKDATIVLDVLEASPAFCRVRIMCISKQGWDRYIRSSNFSRNDSRRKNSSRH